MFVVSSCLSIFPFIFLLGDNLQLGLQYCVSGRKNFAFVLVVSRMPNNSVTLSGRKETKGRWPPLTTSLIINFILNFKFSSTVVMITLLFR